VDVTLLESCASMKSLRSKDGSDVEDSGDDLRGKRRSNSTRESSTDSDAKLFRKGEGA
jgi:hypothetical protein